MTSEPIDTETYIYTHDPELLTGEEWDFVSFQLSGKEKKWLDDGCDFTEIDDFHG